MSNGAPDPMAAPSIRWGILGAGGIARKFVDAVQNHTASTVAAVGARNVARAQAFADEFGIERAHGSYEDLAADPGIDAIYVATPHSHHHAHALIAIAGGKHVLIEKSVTRNTAEAEEVFAAAAKAKVFCMEAMWTRFLPHMGYIKEAVDRGDIGAVVSVEADHGQPIAHIPRMREPELAGGALLDLGVYPVSFAHFILGVPKSITAVGQLTDTKVDGQVAMVLDYGDEGQAVLHTTMWTRTPCRAVISGTEGRIEIDEVFYTPTTFRIVKNDGTTWTVDARVPNGFQYEAAEVARGIAAGRLESEILSHEHSLDVMRTMDQIRSQIGLVYPGE